MPEKKMGFVDKAVDKKAAEIRKRDPNNAYGTAEARKKVLAKVQADIDARDRRDEDAVEKKPLGVDFIGGKPAVYRKVGKMEKMAYDDQAKRTGRSEEGVFGMKHLVVDDPKDQGISIKIRKAKDGTPGVFPDARKKGVKPEDLR